MVASGNRRSGLVMTTAQHPDALGEHRMQWLGYKIVHAQRMCDL